MPTRAIRTVIRRTGLRLAAIGSVSAGLLLVWGLVTPERVPGLATVELVGVIGLLALPVLTALTLRADRRHAPAAPPAAAPALSLAGALTVGPAVHRPSHVPSVHGAPAEGHEARPLPARHRPRNGTPHLVTRESAETR